MIFTKSMKYFAIFVIKKEPRHKQRNLRHASLHMGLKNDQTKFEICIMLWFLKTSNSKNNYIFFCIIILRTDSSRGGPFLFFSDYFQSFKDTITHLISYERVYYSLSNDIDHIIIVYDACKICLKNLFFYFYFLNTGILVTVNCISCIFKPCLQNILN